jgi:hypothetical protein
MTFGESTINQQLLALNETLINFLGKGSDGKACFNTNFSTNNNCYQLCCSEAHVA